MRRRAMGDAAEHPPGMTPPRVTQKVFAAAPSRPGLLLPSADKAKAVLGTPTQSDAVAKEADPPAEDDSVDTLDMLAEMEAEFAADKSKADVKGGVESMLDMMDARIDKRQEEQQQAAAVAAAAAAAAGTPAEVCPC